MSSRSLTPRGWATLLAAVLGWMGAGIEMSLMSPTTRPAIQHFLGPDHPRIEILADQWLSWFVSAFLLGAAGGGLLFGWLGDRVGRVRALGASILTYSTFTGLGYLATTPEQLLALRFVACLGIGGTWPNGVTLVGEALPNLSRPLVAGVIGASANFGFLALGLLMSIHPITRDSWRWVMLLGATPAVLGLIIWVGLPESAEWLRQKGQGVRASSQAPSIVGAVFRPPLLSLTLLGILLGTIPLLGGWASGQRLVPWAGHVAEQRGLPDLKATTQTVLAAGAIVGSLMGGWAATLLGRRLSYFLMSAASLGLSALTFRVLDPIAPGFQGAVFALSWAGTMYYGWLPFYLPEIFPTAVRATGIGVSFNFGRILSAVAMMLSTILSSWFGGDIAKMGAAASLVYAGGLALAFFIPKTKPPS